MKAYHWYLAEDGYHKLHQYIRADGLICAEVYGSNFEPEQGWFVTRETPTPSKSIGRYKTVEQAKVAAMNLFTPKRERREESK